MTRRPTLSDLENAAPFAGRGSMSRSTHLANHARGGAGGTASTAGTPGAGGPAPDAVPDHGPSGACRELVDQLPVERDVPHDRLVVLGALRAPRRPPAGRDGRARGVRAAQQSIANVYHTIGDDVTLYQGVTLGGTSLKRPTELAWGEKATIKTARSGPSAKLPTAA